MIKVLIADDSPTSTKFLQSLLASEKDFEVIGTAQNGQWQLICKDDETFFQ